VRMDGSTDGTNDSNGIDSDSCHDRGAKTRARLRANISLGVAAGSRALEAERPQQLQSGARTGGKRRRAGSNDTTSEGQSASSHKPQHATQVQFTPRREQARTVHEVLYSGYEPHRVF
jgi:hypothetical protein